MQHGILVTSTEHIIDEWYAPVYIHNHGQQEQWFDHDHGIAYRIRRTEVYPGTFNMQLDSKQLTTANNHNTFEEEVLFTNNQAATDTFLSEHNYYKWLTLDKQRRYFSTPARDLVITMDTVEGVDAELGFKTVLEVEYAGKGTRSEALSEIKTYIKELGLGEYEQFDKSMTVESMHVLAKFQ